MDAEVWREAKGVLAEALLCPPDERDAWVDERCPDLLLRREVHACLQGRTQILIDAAAVIRAFRQ
jgi:hypothetical protein